MRSKILIIAMFSATAVFGGVTATWTGEQDCYWTNAANWLVDGAVPERCPGVVTGEVAAVTGPNQTCGLPSRDIAVFDGTCTNGSTIINLDGLYSVQSVMVCGEDCPLYTFGVSAAQILPLETNGVFQVDASVPAASCPVVNASLAISNFEYGWWEKAGVGKILTVVNNSSGTIEFNSRFAAQRRRPNTIHDKYMEFEVEIAGTGNFRFNCNQSHDNTWLPTYYYKHSGTMEINADFTEQKRVNVSASSRVVIAEGCTYGTFVGNNVGYEVSDSAVFTIEGEGTFRFVENKGAKLDNCGYSKVNGGTIAIYSKVESYASNLESPRVILSDTSYNANNGLKLYCPPADIRGGVLFRGESQLSVASTNSLGNCGKFVATNSVKAAFRWKGITENEALTVPVGYLGDERSTFSVWNMGEVPFAVRSGVTAPDADKTFALHGESAPIVCAPDIVDSVALRLSGDIIIPPDATFPNCSKLELQNCRLSIEGAEDRTLPPISVLSGENSVVFAGQVKLTLPSVSVTAGSVDFKVAGSGASVVISGRNSSDVPPAGLLIDGHGAAFTDGGEVRAVATAVDETMASRGDTVPDDSAKVVGITRVGTGGANVLAADATSVKAIVQQSDDPSVIAIGEGQSLTVEEIAIDHGGAALTIGSEPGKGVVRTSSSCLNLRNDSHVSPFAVNAKIDASNIVRNGAGTIVLAGDMIQPVERVELNDGVTVLEDGGWNTTSGSKIVVADGAKLVAADGARLVSDIGVAPVDVNNATIELDGGFLKIEQGAAVTNMIVFNPKGEGRISAVHQTGGAVFAQGNPTTNFYMFGKKNSQGYWEVAGGTLCLTGRISMCGDYSTAALRQSGGMLLLRNPSALLRVGAGSNAYAEYVMTGGYSLFGAVNIRDWGQFKGTEATITIDGPDAECDVVSSVQMVFQNNNSIVTESTRGVLNLVSGTFRANCAIRGASSGITIDRSMTQAFVNFNGGTFKTRVNIGENATDGLFGGESSWVDYVTVYSGGATIETDGDSRKVYVRTPFRRPEGKGIASIAPIRKRTGLVAPPHVVIEGDGKGASAYAVFDREKGEVTGIRIASPGWGYTAATARLQYGSPSSTYSKGSDICTVELADVESGGLTKAGPGTLVLAAASTYTGETVLKGGTLELSAAGAVPAASTVAYEGGALASTAEAFPETLRVRISGAEDGSVRRCTIATFKDSCPAVLPEVEVVNVPEEKRRNWVAEFRGLSLCVKRMYGTVMTVR